MIHIPDFATKTELFEFLKKNKALHITAKKATFKRADSVVSSLFSIDEKKDSISKAQVDPEIVNMESFKVAVVINTTNLMDSHSDVHIPGLWTKSLKEQKMLYLLKEHNMTFESIISDEVKALAKTMSWVELGYPYQGNTQALVFNAKIEKERNPYMAEQYAKDRVKNHSVGMRYVQIELAMNSESQYDDEEKKVWDKYIDKVANREAAEEQGYFWAVTEAKVVEGSAVPLGSNFATPTISVGKNEPLESTHDEPEKSTQKIDWNKIINEIKLINK